MVAVYSVIDHGHQAGITEFYINKIDFNLIFPRIKKLKRLHSSSNRYLIESKDIIIDEIIKYNIWRVTSSSS